MKTEEQNAVINRRRWLTSVVRYGALGGIALMVSVLAGRQISRGCPKLTSNCNACQLLPRCRLPLAESARRTSAHASDSRGERS